MLLLHDCPPDLVVTTTIPIASTRNNLHRHQQNHINDRRLGSEVIATRRPKTDASLTDDPAACLQNVLGEIAVDADAIGRPAASSMARAAPGVVETGVSTMSTRLAHAAAIEAGMMTEHAKTGLPKAELRITVAGKVRAERRKSGPKPMSGLAEIASMNGIIAIVRVPAAMTTRNGFVAGIWKMTRIDIAIE